MQFQFVITFNSAEGNKDTLKDLEAGLIQVSFSGPSNPPNYFLAADTRCLANLRWRFPPEDVDPVSKFQCFSCMHLTYFELHNQESCATFPLTTYERTA